MKDRNRADLLLIEILIAVFFFMLSLTVLVRIFASARNTVYRADAETRALAEAQNVAETLYGADDPESVLKEAGYIASHGVFSRRFDDFAISVTVSRENTAAGVMHKAEVRGFCHEDDPEAKRQSDEELFVLPCAWYLAGQPG